VLAITGKKAYLASTAEGFLLTYEADGNESYNITCKVSLGGRHICLNTASYEGNFVIWEDEERWETLLVKIDDVGDWRSLYTTGSGGCCDWLHLSPNCKAISIGDCGSVGLMGINIDAAHDPNNLRWFEGHPDLIYAPDDSIVIVRDEIATRSLTLPNLNKERVFAEVDDIPDWLHTYDAWKKESIHPVYRCRDDEGFVENITEPTKQRHMSLD
jgi:hypothetical protein